MSEAASLGVIRDLFGLTMLALGIAVLVYAVLRAGGGSQWNYQGDVLSRPYGWPDAVAACLLLVFFWNSAVSPSDLKGGGAVSTEVSEPSLLLSMIFMLLLAMALLVFMKIRGLNPGEMFGIRQMPAGRALRIAMGASILVYAAMVGVGYLMEKGFFGGKWPDSGAQEPVEAFQHASSLLFKITLAASAIFVAPVYEETIFRGFLYGICKRYTDRWFSAIFTSAVFACVHRSVGAFVPLFVLALGLSLTYEATGCLLVAMFMHGLFNAWNILIMVFHPS